MRCIRLNANTLGYGQGCFYEQTLYSLRPLSPGLEFFFFLLGRFEGVCMGDCVGRMDVLCGCLGRRQRLGCWWICGYHGGSFVFCSRLAIKFCT